MVGGDMIDTAMVEPQRSYFLQHFCINLEMFFGSLVSLAASVETQEDVIIMGGKERLSLLPCEVERQKEGRSVTNS